MYMGRPMTQLTVESNVRKAREKVVHCKAQYDAALNELDKALAQQDKFIADKILKAMKKKRKPLEEVLRLINL